MLQVTGKVWLVGAGPGDPDLLTLKAVRALQRAEAVVYDRLVSPEVLAMAPAGAARIFVGKEPGRHPVPQDDINTLLVRLARAGRRVVRLKGGDPFIFGRGSEEALELNRQGIRFEIVPGITAAQGCAAALATPLTHRGLASGVRYLTGHCRDGLDLEFDWPGLADPDTTLVVYMGHANAGEIAARLIANGRAGSTPVLIVNNGTTPRQRERLTTLARLGPDVEAAQYDGPVLFVIGAVAGLAAEMGRMSERREHDAHAAVV